MAELADAPDLGSGVLRRAGSSPVIRTFSQRDLTDPFFHFTNQIDPWFCYSYLNHPNFVNFLIWFLLTLSQVIHFRGFCRLQQYLLLCRSSAAREFRWLLQHLLSSKSPTACIFVDPYSTYFPASHQQPAFSLTPTALTFQQVTNSLHFRWPLQHLLSPKLSALKNFPAT